jgi:glutamine amidotransferase
MSISIAVIDYDMGNLHSVCKGLEISGARAVVTNNPTQILQAQAVVLPGVGSFDPAMEKLNSLGLVQVIKEVVAGDKPLLGICLGLQLLFESSQEGKKPGLGLLAGEVRRFQSQPGLTIPHMGWNQLELTQPEHPLWQNIEDPSYVYFVHSYYVAPSNLEVNAAMVTHGEQRVCAAIAQDNLMAVQFHPEKSSKTGLKILSNFVELLLK